jgi:hypothetical protein
MTPIPASHADHDPLAIAAHAAGDATGSELDDALALVAACADCAALHHDLRSIAAALPDLPAPVRTRDFRLTPGQAASLRPAGWRRLLAPLAGPRFAFTGPLGTGLATLGIVGFLAAGAIGAPLAGTAAVPGDAAALGSGGPVAAVPAPSEAPMAASGAPATSAPIEMAPAGGTPTGEGPIAQAPASPEPVGVGSGAGASGYDPLSGSDAASPGISSNLSGTGGGGPIESGAADPKTGDGRERVTLAAPGEVATDQATDAVVQAAPAAAPLVVLAGAMLVAGLLLGGLRLIARRAA